MNSSRPQDENNAPPRGQKSKNQSRRKTDDNAQVNYNQNASTSRGPQSGNRRGRGEFGYRNNKNNQHYWRGDAQQPNNIDEQSQKKLTDAEKEKQMVAQKRGPLPDWDEVADTGKEEMFDYMDMMEQQYAQYYAIAGCNPYEIPFGIDPQRYPMALQFRPQYPIGVPPTFVVPNQIRPVVSEETKSGKTSTVQNDDQANGSRPESADSSLTASIPPTPLLSPDAVFNGAAIPIHPVIPVMGPSFPPPYVTDAAKLKDLVRRQM